MELVIKDLDIATGGIKVVILNQKDAEKLDLHHMDRIRVKKGKQNCVATLDIAESRKAVPSGKIGMFEETLTSLKAKHGQKVKIKLAKKPESVYYIKEKLKGKKLNSKEIMLIVKDIVNDELTDIELTSYVLANYTQGMTAKEVYELTKAMMKTGTT
ncbi:thymidine phosphorylase, partial [Candidatus Woesearchaeota archaeon]|nr:thymidine phosphorylase [Candidatus Woesearchaeota archaeon]